MWLRVWRPALAMVAGLAGIGSPGPHHQHPAKPDPAPAAQHAAAAGYRLGPQDVISVDVWQEPQISSRDLPVRPDGMISVPLAGQIRAEGLTPAQLQAAIARRLRPYLSDPAVTVQVDQVRSHKLYILGRVHHPGIYVLAGPTRVLDAIAMAGGLAEFANRRHIYVLRRLGGGRTRRIAFNYKRVIAGKDAKENIRLRPGDTVVVP
ncbi:MAG: polysaccharide biosynthesis/export family protein [Terriglobales bacterium]